MLTWKLQSCDPELQAKKMTMSKIFFHLCWFNSYRLHSLHALLPVNSWQWGQHRSSSKVPGCGLVDMLKRYFATIMKKKLPRRRELPRVNRTQQFYASSRLLLFGVTLVYIIIIHVLLVRFWLTA